MNHYNLIGEYFKEKKSIDSKSGYSFSNNLPSTTGALFANTIYGVYHDIDPSVGGEVGWELMEVGVKRG